MLVFEDGPCFDRYRLRHSNELCDGQEAWEGDLDRVNHIVLCPAPPIVAAISIPYGVAVVILKWLVIVATTIGVNVLIRLSSGLRRLGKIPEISAGERNR